MGKKGLNGFTLVEITVAMVILSLMASGLFSVMVSARHLVERSKKRFIAVEYAKAEIEDMRESIRWDLWSLANASDPLDPDSTWRAWDNTSYVPYRVRYRVEADSGGGAFRKVTVEVRWNATTL